MIEFRKINITEITHRMGSVIHQCNCLTQGKAKGVAAKIFKKFPYSDIYKERKVEDVPGHIAVCHPPKESDGPVVINLLAQYYPGPPRSGYDTPQDRDTWLRLCLDKLMDRVTGPAIHFPFEMGCNLAKGNWSETLSLIESYSQKFNKQFICCKNE